MLNLNALCIVLLLSTAVVLADGPYLTTEEEDSAASNLTIHQQLVLLDQIRLEDQPRFKAELAKIRQLPLTQLADIAYLTLLNAYEQALQGQYDKVLPILTPLLETSTDNEIITRARIMAANVLLLSNNHTLAFTYFEQLINTIPTITEPELLGQVIFLVILTFNELERYDLALLYVRYIDFNSISAKLACRIRVTELDAKLLQAGSIATEDEANKVIADCVAAREVIPANLARKELMRHLLKHNDSKAALTLYQRHVAEIEQTNYPILISQVSALAAQAHLLEGDVEQAKILAEQALLSAQSSPNNFALVEAYNTLYQIAKTQQDFQQALSYLELMHQIEDEFNTGKASQQAAYHTVRSQIELKNQRINLLDRDNELLVLQQSIYREEVKNSRLLLLLSALLGSIALVFAYRGLAGRKRFKLMAEYDQLTGISNRYHFNYLAKQALRFCQSRQKPVAMILFDIDHFKLINDQFGHATGDWALQQIVLICKQFMRSNDIFGRIGGEEFVIMLPDCELDKASLLAEICRDAVVGIETTSIEYDFSLSASFGVSGSNISGYDIKQLLSDADKAMYQAKTNGRNQVVEFSKTVP
jgi:diguanylate cyclase (GGDEF)-like protein